MPLNATTYFWCVFVCLRMHATFAIQVETRLTFFTLFEISSERVRCADVKFKCCIIRTPIVECVHLTCMYITFDLDTFIGSLSFVAAVAVVAP